MDAFELGADGMDMGGGGGGMEDFGGGFEAELNHNDGVELDMQVGKFEESVATNRPNYFHRIWRLLLLCNVVVVGACTITRLPTCQRYQ